MDLNNQQSNDEYDVFNRFRDEKLEKLEVHFKTLQSDVRDIKPIIDKIFTSVAGNKEMGTIGIAERLMDIEKEFMMVKEEIERLKEHKIRNSVYIKQLAWICGLVGTFILLFYLKSTLK